MVDAGAPVVSDDVVVVGDMNVIGIIPKAVAAVVMNVVIPEDGMIGCPRLSPPASQLASTARFSLL